MLLLTSLLPCQELWALGEQLYLCMAVVTALFAVISLLKNNSHLVEVAPRGAEDLCFSWEEVPLSIPAGRCPV